MTNVKVLTLISSLLAVVLNRMVVGLVLVFFAGLMY